jgi:serine protease DegQ
MRPCLVGLTVLLMGLPLWAGDSGKAVSKTYQVPYRLADSNHIVVRARINGKGPFNLVVDTGAPYLFVATPASRQAGVEPDDKGWGVFERVELEGGVVVEKIKGRVDKLARLEAANQLGLIGLPIHGLIGYDLLARYRIELDLTKSKMTWTRLDFQPPAASGVGKKSSDPAEIDALAGILKMAGSLLGKTSAEEKPRGFLGVELADANGAPTVKTVLARSPAAMAGLQVDDRITHIQEQPVQTSADLLRLAAKLTAGETVTLKVERGRKSETIAIKLGGGL